MQRGLIFRRVSLQDSMAAVPRTYTLVFNLQDAAARGSTPPKSHCLKVGYSLKWFFQPTKRTGSSPHCMLHRPREIANLFWCRRIYCEGRLPDKGEVGGSSPPRPTIQISVYAAILAFAFLRNFPQSLCQRFVNFRNRHMTSPTSPEAP